MIFNIISTLRASTTILSSLIIKTNFHNNTFPFFFAKSKHFNRTSIPSTFILTLISLLSPWLHIFKHCAKCIVNAAQFHEHTEKNKPLPWITIHDQGFSAVKCQLVGLERTKMWQQQHNNKKKKYSILVRLMGNLHYDVWTWARLVMLLYKCRISN